MPLTFKDGRKEYTVNKPFEGVIGNLNRRMLQTESAWMREELAKFQTAQPCETCGGKRLNEKALAVKIAGDATSPTADRAVASPTRWNGSRDLPDQLTDTQNQIARAILKEINERLGFLNNVGLDYLNLDRTSGTLSGGESQRIRLASQIGSGLSGVLYVLDEPSIGLHQRDNDRLLETLKRLRDLGNTVIVVEHDEDAIRTRRPHGRPRPRRGRARRRGGGAGHARNRSSRPRTRSPPTTSPAAARSRSRTSAARATASKLTVHGARRQQPARTSPPRIPLGTFTCVTGVSGSGKSSFTIDTLYAAAARTLNGARVIAGRARQGHRARILRQGDRDRPVAHRPHPALQPGDLHRRLHPDPRLVRRPARKRRRAATSRAASASTSRAAAARRARATG